MKLEAGQTTTIQGCYLGRSKNARTFRLASWDRWEPHRYGNQLHFVNIVTNNGDLIPLEHGQCYQATVRKHVNSDQEDVCVDHDSTYSLQYPCTNQLTGQRMAVFLLYPDREESPHDYSRNIFAIAPPS